MKVSKMYLPCTLFYKICGGFAPPEEETPRKKKRCAGKWRLNRREGSESQDTAVLRRRSKQDWRGRLGGSRMQNSRGKEPWERLTEKA